MKLNPSTNFSIEKFKSNLWTNFSSPFSVEDEEWIEQSYHDPTFFWTSLLTLQQGLSPTPIRSQFNEQYDFYHDAVTRHIESNNAFVLIDEGGFTTPWTYKKLHRLVNFQVKQWTKYALKPGQVVAITTPSGPYFWLALLTTLRLGLTICYLPPDPSLLPPTQITSLINEIRPDLVVSDPQSKPSYTHSCPHHLLEDLLEDEQNHPPHSHAYPASQVMQLSLALHRTQPYAVVPLEAQTCYLHALRDGLLTMNLKPGTCWSAPLASPLQVEPCSTLSSLLSGATFVHVADQTFQKDPFLLKEEKIHLLGISSKLQKLLSKEPVLPSKSLKGLFTPHLIAQPLQWKSFIQLQSLEKTPFSQTLVDNSLGGITLFSKPALDFSLYLKPSLAAAWSLKDLNNSGDDSLAGFGRFHFALPTKENSKHDYNFLVSHIEKNCLISSTLEPCREGITVPIKKVEEALSQLPFIEACMLHHSSKMGSILSNSLILLVFVDPLKNDLVNKMQPTWTQDINQQISQHVGSHYLPDRIEFYCLTPKKIDSSIDREWCAQQYDRGFFSMKRNTQLYLFLSIVRKLAKEKSKEG